MLNKFLPRDFTSLLIFALTLGYLAFIWSFGYFPTMDGPSHISNSKTIADLLLGRCEHSVQAFEITKTLVPNWGGHFIAATLSSFLEPELINKILVTILVLTTAGGYYRLISVISPQNLFMALFGMIFTLSGALYAGAYNYLIGANILLFATAYWFEAFPKNKLKKSILFLYFFLLYFSHIFTLVGFCFIIFFTIIWHMIAYKEYSLLKLCVTIGLVFLPFALMFAHYYSLPKMGIASFVNPIHNLITIILVQTVYTFSNADNYLTYFLTLVYWQLLFLAIYRTYREKIHVTRVYIFGIVLLFIIIAFAPVSFAGGWVIGPRLQYLMIIISIIMFSSLSYGKTTKAILTVIFLLINIGLIVSKYPYTEKLDNRLTQIMSVKDKIPNNSTFMTVNLSPTYYDFKSREEIMRIMVPDITGYFSYNACVTNLANFHSSEKNIFPIKYKDNFNPYDNMGKFRDQYSDMLIPPDIDFAKYKKATGVIPDYIILLGKKEFLFNHSAYDEKKLYRKFMAQVDELYTLKSSDYDDTIRIYGRK